MVPWNDVCAICTVYFIYTIHDAYPSAIRVTSASDLCDMCGEIIFE